VVTNTAITVTQHDTLKEKQNNTNCGKNLIKKLEKETQLYKTTY